MGRKRPTLMDIADEAGVHIPRSCCAGTCAVCEVKITRGGRERTVRACTATPRDEDVVDVSSGDAELARMMARFEGQDGLDYGRCARGAVQASQAAAARVRGRLEGARAGPPTTTTTFSIGGAAPWDVDDGAERSAKSHKQGRRRVRVRVRRRVERDGLRGQPRVGRTC